MQLTKQDKEIIDNDLKFWMSKEYIQWLLWTYKRTEIIKYIKEKLSENLEKDNLKQNILNFSKDFYIKEQDLLSFNDILSLDKSIWYWKLQWKTIIKNNNKLILTDIDKNDIDLIKNENSSNYWFIDKKENKLHYIDEKWNINTYKIDWIDLNQDRENLDFIFFTDYFIIKDIYWKKIINLNTYKEEIIEEGSSIYILNKFYFLFLAFYIV